jgi:hypothetical protein
MDQSRLAKRIMKVSQREEKVGRSKWRWLDDVEIYKGELKLKKRRQEVYNRREWASAGGDSY